MSKYVKLEEVIETVYQCRRAEANDEWIKRWLEPLNSLPTIEVSEEVLKATKKFNAYTIADENAEMGMRTMIEPIIEVSEDCISEFRDYQIEWLTSHCDLELEPVLEDFIVRFLKDTAETFIKENAPSVVPTTEQSSKVGEWVESEIPNELYVCSECGGACWSYDWDRTIVKSYYCPNCGAKMKG